jgi:quercetin dioxygenase-like cupin family protein
MLRRSGLSSREAGRRVVQVRPFCRTPGRLKEAIHVPFEASTPGCIRFSLRGTSGGTGPGTGGSRSGRETDSPHGPGGDTRFARGDSAGRAVRAVHAHNDVEYHLWIPLEGRLEITIESEPPTIATPGQAFFLQRGTQHGFRNVGTAPAAVMEVFVKETDIAALSDTLKELGVVMAQSHSALPSP